MKKVMITLEVPEATDDFFRTEAQRRTCSKSAVIRGVLADHVAQVNHRKAAPCPPTPSVKTPSTSR